MRCYLASVCVGRPSFGGRRTVFGSRERFCSSVGLGCPSFGGQRTVCALTLGLTSALVPNTSREKSKVSAPLRRVAFLLQFEVASWWPLLKEHFSALPWQPR
jgi:hypothetical protein